MAPLKTLAFDYAGPLPKSITNKNLLLIVYCIASKMAFVIPIVTKACVVEEIRNVIVQVRRDYSVDLNEKIVYHLRRDTEVATGSAAMQQMMTELRVQDDPIVPYNPEQNSHAERYVRSAVDALRCTMHGVDRRIWCFGARYVGSAWNRLPHNYPKLPHHSGKSPLQIMEEKIGRSTNRASLEKLRRFGSLCYFKIQGTKPKKLDDKWQRGVFLGIHEPSGGWIVGFWKTDGRAKADWVFGHTVTNDVRFREEILIGDLDHLRPSSQGIYFHWDEIDAQQLDGSSQHSEGGRSVEANRLARSFEPERTVDATRSKAQEFPEIQIEGEEESIPALQPGIPSDDSPRVPDPPKSKRPRAEKEPGAGDDGPPVKRRGRPAGAKDRKKRHRRTKHEIERDMALMSAVMSGEDFEEGEELLEATVQLSVSKALSGPDSKEWDAAISLEEHRLLAYETWIPASDHDLATYRARILPIAIILTVKRCGTRKARACVLGNLDSEGNLDSYAPVCTQAAHRFLMTEAITEGDHVLPYDLNSAFLNALMGRTVLCRLPPVWASKHGNSVVKLKKSLYGLREAPRNWYKEYHTILRGLGWEPCLGAPGLWKKPSRVRKGKFLKKSVYVDDNMATGPDLPELRAEVELIFTKVSGRMIKMKEYKDEKGIKWQEFDFLGQDCYYAREARMMKITMSTYLTKLALKYKEFLRTRKTTSPAFNEEDMEDGKEEPKFNYRGLVGSLQWAVTCARPDALVPTATLAKSCAKTPTRGMISCAKKVLRYLCDTKDEGVEYSDEGYTNFFKVYNELLPPGRDFPDLHLFGDAGFANNIKSLHSTSGSIGYWKSVPLFWRSGKQGVRAMSTAESEYIACSDTLTIGETNNFYDFFRKLPSKTAEVRHGVATGGELEKSVVWCDNTSAIATAKGASTGDTKPRSRHYALRFLKVQDAVRRLCFCPTLRMRADALTKMSTPLRTLLLHNVTPATTLKYEYDNDYDTDDEGVNGSDHENVNVSYVLTIF